MQSVCWEWCQSWPPGDFRHPLDPRWRAASTIKSHKSWILPLLHGEPIIRDKRGSRAHSSCQCCCGRNKLSSFCCFLPRRRAAIKPHGLLYSLFFPQQRRHNLIATFFFIRNKNRAISLIAARGGGAYSFILVNMSNRELHYHVIEKQTPRLCLLRLSVIEPRSHS